LAETFSLAICSAVLIVFASMIGVTLLLAELLRTKGIAFQAGAVVVLLEALAVSGLAVRALARAFSAPGGLPTPGPLATWLPGVVGLAVGVAAEIWRKRRHAEAQPDRRP
jgi:hypothetical protein